jgi:hypothetical protein
MHFSLSLSRQYRETIQKRDTYFGDGKTGRVIERQPQPALKQQQQQQKQK